MINKLHNLANAILGIEDLKHFDTLYRYSIVNISDYKIELTNSEGLIVNPIKKTRDTSRIEYRLNIGVYYLRCYNKENNKEDYFEEIYVSDEMMNTSRTVKL